MPPSAAALRRRSDRRVKTKENRTMKKNRGSAILRFAILLQLCGSGIEGVSLGLGVLGLGIALADDWNAK